MRIVIVALLLVSAANTRAAHPLITEDTGTQGGQRWQLELNAERTRDDSGGARTYGLQPTATLAYGLSDALDILMTQSYLRQAGGGSRVSGKLDTALDLKWRFHDAGDLSFALKPGLTLPSARDDRGLGAGRVTWGTFLIASRERDGIALHGHVGLRHARNTQAQRSQLWHASAAAVLKASERLRLALDLAWDTDPNPAGCGPLRQSVLGALFSLTPDVDLDAGIRRGNGPAIDRALLFGLTLRW